MFNKTYRIIISLAVGFLGGYILKHYSFPAPYMLGSLLFACIANVILTYLFRKKNNVNNFLIVSVNLRFTALAVIGVILGSYITTTSLTLALGWGISFLQVMVVSVLVTLSSYFYLTRIKAKEKALAWFSSLPGGISELSIQSKEYSKYDSTVIFYHLCRIAAVFLLVPLILLFFKVDVISQASQTFLVSFINSDISSFVIWVLKVAILGIAGVSLGIILKTPMPYMIGPLVLSVFYHLFGADVFGVVVRYSEPILICQTILGTSIGLRLSEIEWKVLKVNFTAGIITTVITLIIVAFLAYIFSTLNSDVKLDFVKYFLIFIPGGVSEMSLLSIAYGYEVAFVTLHHLVRIFTVLFVTQYGAKLLKLKKITKI